MGKPSFLPYAERLKRRLSLNYGARQNAAESVDDLTDQDGTEVLHGADLALLSDHPTVRSRSRSTGGLGTALWEAFPGHVALLDAAGVVVSVNQAWRRFALENQAGQAGTAMTAIAGVSRPPPGSNYLEACQLEATRGVPEATQIAELVRTALTGNVERGRLSYPLQSSTGRRWFSLQVIPMPGPGKGALVVHEDVTDEKELEAELRHRAFHDPLTGLPNRALLTDRLEHAIAGAARDPGSLAVLFVDLDEFKSVNDRFGHLVGDRVLCQAASHMAACLRASDTVGRWGGDEFVVIAERLDAEFTAAQLAARLADCLHEPIVVSGELLHVRASVGVARLEECKSADRLVEAADKALLASRLERRGRPREDPAESGLGATTAGNA